MYKYELCLIFSWVPYRTVQIGRKGSTDFLASVFVSFLGGFERTKCNLTFFLFAETREWVGRIRRRWRRCCRAACARKFANAAWRSPAALRRRAAHAPLSRYAPVRYGIWARIENCLNAEGKTGSKQKIWISVLVNFWLIASWRMVTLV